MKIIEQTDRRLRNAMTVKDLIEALQDCDPDARVLFTCDYGDYSHTQQALPIKDCNSIENGQALVESAYSQSRMALEDAADDDGQGPMADDQYEEFSAAEQNVVILK